MSRRRSFRKSPRDRSTRGFFRARFQTLESRTLLAVFAPMTAADLQTDIHLADTNGAASNTIDLAAVNYLLTSGALLIDNSGAPQNAHDHGGKR